MLNFIEDELALNLPNHWYNPAMLSLRPYDNLPTFFGYSQLFFIGTLFSFQGNCLVFIYFKLISLSMGCVLNTYFKINILSKIKKRSYRYDL